MDRKISNSEDRDSGSHFQLRRPGLRKSNTIAKIDSQFIKRYLDRFAAKASKYHNQIEKHKRYARLEQLFLKLLDRKVEFLTRKGRIDESTSNELSVIINYLCKK